MKRLNKAEIIKLNNTKGWTIFKCIDCGSIFNLTGKRYIRIRCPECLKKYRENMRNRIS